MKKVTLISKFFPKFTLMGLISISLLSLLSCSQDEFVDNGNVVSSPSASVSKFETKSGMNVKLSFKDNDGKPNPGVLVQFYFENPFLEDGLTPNPNIHPNVQVQTNSDGLISTNLPVANFVKQVYVKVQNLMYVHDMVLTRTSSYVSSVYPSGYSVRKYVPSTRATVDAAIRYTRALAPALPVSNKLWTLSSYNSTSGVPSVLETPDAANAALLSRISSALPEAVSTVYDNRATNHYFDNPGDVNVVQNANIWVTFLREGAGVCNSVGYYYYPTGSAPSDTSGITKRIIMFPNASDNTANGVAGNGTTDRDRFTGRMTEGTKVKLKYQNPSTGEWTDVFPAGTTVGWFLVESGWGGSTYDSLFNLLQRSQYSRPAFNYGGSPQTVLLYDLETKKIILGFEDTALSHSAARTNIGTRASDKDFNDVVFAISSNPITAIEKPTITIGQVKDSLYTNTYSGSLAFEDNWPYEGDYDLNDLVLDFTITYMTNSNDDVKSIEFNTSVVAAGATYSNGFAWELNANQSNVESITTTYSGPGSLLGGSLFPLDAKGYESGISASKIVIPFFDNAFTLFGGSNFINTIVGNTYHTPVTLKKKITFTTPVTKASLGINVASGFPFNPFLVVNGTRGREIHLTDRTPSSKINSNYFGMAADNSNRVNQWYRSSSFSRPWALEVTASAFKYPIENRLNNGVNISNTFLHFDAASSNPNNFTDWFTNTASGYRNAANIYSPR